MNKSKHSGHPMTIRQNSLNQAIASAVVAKLEDRPHQDNLPRVRGGDQYSPPALTIMNPDDVCYDYQRVSAWHETHPYVPADPYHQLPHAYRVSTQQAHQHQQASVTKEFVDLSHMVKYESSQLARASSAYLRDPRHVVSDQWAQADVDVVDPASGYTLPNDTASLWQSYYPPSYAGVSRQLGPAPVQLTPSIGFQTFYNHEHLAASSMTESDPHIRRSLSGHLHDSGSRRSSTEESRTSMIQSSGYQVLANSTPFPVLRPSQSEFSGLQRSPPDPPARLQALQLDTPCSGAGSTHMQGYRHGMQILDDEIHDHSCTPRLPSSDRLHPNLHHILVDDSSASTSSSQKHPLRDDVKSKVTPSTSIGELNSV